jgi:hypothetical protein
MPAGVVAAIVLITRTKKIISIPQLSFVAHAITQLKPTLENMVDISVHSVTLVEKNFFPSPYYYEENNNQKKNSKNP